MRITQSMLARASIDQLAAQRNRLAKTQEQAATGLRINRPSDDPVDYRTVLYMKDSLSQTGRYLRTIDLARTQISTTETALSSASEAVSRAKVAGLAASSITNQSPGAEAAYKLQIEQIFEEVLSFANTRSSGGSYVFSGLASDQQAFVSTGGFTGSGGPTVTFGGSASVVEVEIDEGIFIDVTRDGEGAFQGPTDVFDALGRLWAGIDQGSSTEIDGAVIELEVAFDHLLLEQARIGSSEAKANSFESRLQLQEQEFKSQVSFLEDADAFEVYSDLTAQESALQASLQITSRVLQPTLLDFL